MVAAVDIVRVELKAGVSETGVKVATDPSGRPDAERVTKSLKPPIEITETVVFIVSPWATEPESGLADRAKLGIGGTVTKRTTVLVFSKLLPSAATVTLITYSPPGQVDGDSQATS